MTGLDTLDDLFEDGLEDVYDAEKQILNALPDLIEAASNDVFREALIQHLEETETQIGRLEEAFASIDMTPAGKHCAGTAGILREVNELLAEAGDQAVMDAAFIAACQRLEHYEISAYGSLIAWAALLDYSEAVDLLTANEREEKSTDSKLSEIAMSVVNPLAAQSVDLEREGEEDGAEKPLKVNSA